MLPFFPAAAATAAAAWLPQTADTSRSSDRIAATPVCQPLPIQDDHHLSFQVTLEKKYTQGQIGALS